MRWPIVTPGVIAVARPLEPRDGGAVRRLFERLSEESRYRRFLSPKATLSERELDALIDVDGRDRVAILVELAGSGEAIAVGRFVRVDPADDVADLAVAVVDEWQGRGVGTRLLELLIDQARSRGVHRLRALTLANNRPMLAALRRRGFAGGPPTGHSVELELWLDPTPHPAVIEGN